MKPLSTEFPHVIVMVGVPGAGKTHFAQRFAETFKAPFVSAGALTIKGLSASDADAVAESFLDELMKTGRTILYEPIQLTGAVRQALLQRITKAGYHPMVVWVQTDSVEALRRSKKMYGTTPQQFEQLLKQFTVPSAAEKPVVISGKHTYTSQLKIVLKHLAAPHALKVKNATTSPAQRPPASRNIVMR